MINFGLLHHAVDHWARHKPTETAVFNATRGTRLTWAELAEGSRRVATALVGMGLRKGDFLAATLPLSNEHILLEYACFRLGVIHAPLDLRLPPAEVIRCVRQINARVYAFPPAMGPADFPAMAAEVKRQCPSVEHLVHSSKFAALLEAEPLATDCAIEPGEGAQAIFTTGSTGSPKPALLSHAGILGQNVCIGRAFGFGPGERVLNNLPASHVGGQAELLITSITSGGTMVGLEVFDAAASLDAIEKYGVTILGQIPAMFNLEWRTSNYAARNLSSLKVAVYGGQGVPKPFLERMLTMAPRIATGLGLTEASGFCTYTAMSGDVDLIGRSLGYPAPEYEMSVRKAMRDDGFAGEELSSGETGHVCFRGAQNFLGYVNDPRATAAALSRDGWLYTGDLGSSDEHGLKLAGRASFVLKPAGYQVFPGDIENHLAAIAEKVAIVGVVGQPHQLWSEGIVAFVERRPESELTDVELRRHARVLASYMRPLHYVVMEPGTMPLNRAAKVDVMRLRELARVEVEKLRERGRWDGEAADAVVSGIS